MTSVNEVTLLGRLGKDPAELRYLSNGKPTTKLSLATGETYKDKNGQKQEKTQWHTVEVYDQAAEFAAEHLKKGSLVWVKGQIEYQKSKDDRYFTVIRCFRLQSLDPKPRSRVEDAPPEETPREQMTQDDIPF